MAERRLQKMNVGDKVTTRPRVVTATDIETYAAITGHLHPAFLSDEYIKTDEHARALGFKTRLTPGILVQSFAIGSMILEGLFDDVIAMMGANNIRYLVPVYPYDTLKTDTEILSKRETKGERVVVSYKWVVKNQNDVAVTEGEST